MARHRKIPIPATRLTIPNKPWRNIFICNFRHQEHGGNHDDGADRRNQTEQTAENDEGGPRPIPESQQSDAADNTQDAETNEKDRFNEEDCYRRHRWIGLN